MPYITVNNHSLHYSDSSTNQQASDSPPKATIILVHGLGSTQNYYFPILPDLSSYRCITFDNYGAGRSKLVSGQPESSIPLIASDVLALMDALNVPKAIIVGYSMGGMVPTYLAATNPSRVQAGICIGPVHPTPAVAEVFKKRIPAVKQGGMEAMANTIPYAATGSKATDLQKSFIREMILGQEMDGYVANCRAIETAEPPSYEQVKCPILIVAGSEDKSAPLQGCKEIFGRLGTDDGKKRLEVLEGVGHWYCVEAGDDVARVILEFLKQFA